MNLAHRIVDLLVEKGVRKIFGIPGIGNQPLLDAIYGRKDIEFVLTRHEQAAAIMADCWGRVKGEVGVCTASFEAGSTNLINGIAQAFSMESPVLVLVGERDLRRGPPPIDLVSLFKPVTKLALRVQTPENALPIIEEAFRTALSEPKGPVYVGVPVDIQTAEVEEPVSWKPRSKPISYPDETLQPNRLKPLSVAEFLSRRIPKEAIVTVDVGDHMVCVFRTFKGFNLVTSGSLYSMGFAFPAALSAKVVFPEKPVYCITGDGGFLMVLQELETAVRENLKVIVILFDNRCLGMVKRRQEREFGGRFIGVEFGEIDFPLVARGFGAYGERVNSFEELEAALWKAERADKTFLIDIAVGWREEL